MKSSGARGSKEKASIPEWHKPQTWHLSIDISTPDWWKDWEKPNMNKLQFLSKSLMNW